MRLWPGLQKPAPNLWRDDLDDTDGAAGPWTPAIGDAAPADAAFYENLNAHDIASRLVITTPSGKRGEFNMADRTNIRHVVFFSAKDRADVPRIVEGLWRLADIPHSEVFEVRQNTRDDALSAEVDVVVYAEFKNQDALTAYKAHPLYQVAIDIVRPLRDLRIAADF